MKLPKMAVKVSERYWDGIGTGVCTHECSYEVRSLLWHSWTEVPCLVRAVKSCGNRVLAEGKSQSQYCFLE